MAINVLLQASGTLFGASPDGFDADVEVQLVGGPVSIRLSPRAPIDFQAVWNGLSNTLEEIAGFGLPDLGAWKGIFTAPSLIEPSLYLSPSGSNGDGLSVYVELAFVTPIKIGGSIDLGGGVTVSIEPNFEIWSIYIGYDKGAGGMSIRAKVVTPTQAGPSSPGGSKSQIVSYPFPVPSQSGLDTFQVHYLGLGQRVGPTVQVTAADPMQAIFDQLETELAGDDPTTVLTTLAQSFYQPDRDWFIAADLSMKGFRIRVLFNDPVMYGLEITVDPKALSPFAGLLFEILYQRLSPNLGLYYGALTLPTLMRQIPLNGFILILPGFAIWIYTNGDFRVNVGWPLGDNSIGLSLQLLVGRAAFYFAKLSGADNPGAQASDLYGLILAFGLGVSLNAGKSFNASIFSASLQVSLACTFQGLLAWETGHQVSQPPDHYWFAGTASISVLIQGTVDFSIIKASVIISFNANAGVAFETGYATLITISASVRVEVSVKVVFFTIHLSFHTSVSTQFTIGSGTPASINGPLAPGLAIVGGFGAELAPVHAEALRAVDRAMARLHPAAPFGNVFRPRLTAEAVELLLDFVLQPTAVFSGTPAFNLIASLVMDCPAPGAPAGSGGPAATSFEKFISALVSWLLGFAPGPKLSERFKAVVQLLGAGSAPPMGDWSFFALKLRSFMEERLQFRIRAAGTSSPSPDRSTAMMPMLDALQLSALDASGKQIVVDFDSYNPTPANYPLAVNLYFQDLAFSGSAPAESAARAMASPDGGPSMATFVQVDWFLLQARNAANALLQAAEAYEGTARQTFLDEVDRTHLGGLFERWTASDLVNGYAASLSEDDELAVLLEQFDYASAAGMGSRFLLGGLQLPVPSLVPPQPTPENMAKVPAAPLYQLTGQQFSAATGALASATLSVNPAAGAPAGWISFEQGSPEESTTADLQMPSQLPQPPSPSWHGATSPTAPGEGSIDVETLPPVSPHQLYVAMKSQIAWSDDGAARTILPFGEEISSLLTARGGLQLQISSDAPPSTNGPLPPPSPASAVAAAPALLISLTLSQVQLTNPGGVTQGGSPPVGSPAAGAGQAASYLPFVYQLGGADEATRDLIHQALIGDLSSARISLLYTAEVPAGSPTASPARMQTILCSEPLDPEVLIAKTNLSTLNQVPATGQVFARMAALTGASASDLAPASDVAGFLRLIWELSVVNAPGYFLFYSSSGGGDLPASLFKSPGAEGGQTAQLDVLVELLPESTTTQVPECANAAVLGEGGVSQALYANVADASGRPVLTTSLTYAAGNVGLSLFWDHPASSPSELVPLEDLYHLLQYRVAAQGAYSGSVWSLPITPLRDNGPAMLRRQDADSLWSYLQTVPAWLFLTGGSPGGPVNRYAVIDQEISVELRIVDIYGDALPDVHRSQQRPLYGDPLVAIGEWPGLFTQYRVTAGTGGAASLQWLLRFDPDAVAPPGDSPGVGVDPRNAWTVALGRYQLIVDQLTDPNVTLQISSTLAGGAVGDAASNRTKLVGFAQAVAASIAQALASAPSPDVPSVPPRSISLDLPLPFAKVVALQDDVFPVTVSVALSRPKALVDPAALEALPGAASVSSSISPDLDGPGSSPGSAGNLTAFAVPFEQAFQDFDGDGGCLKLAQRAGVQTGQDAAAIPAIWAMRWSRSCGFSVELGDELAFFALAPLSTVPLTHEVDGQTSANVDLDAWARDFLAAFDALLQPQLAVAIGVLDQRDGTSLYEEIADLKQQLSATIPLGVRALFDDGPLGDLGGARDRLQQSLLTALASAYTVTTLVQVPVQVGVTPSPGPFSPNVAPRLYGSLGPPDRGSSPGGPSPQGAVPYTLSPGELALASGPAWMTSLLTVAQPGEQSELLLPLAYQVSYLQHDFEPQDAFLGYVPSSWLKLALPDAAPLTMPITAPGEQVALPVPLTLEPTLPLLAGQQGTAAPLGSPASPVSAADEISAALRWIYGTQLGLSLSAQDELFLDVTYNALPERLSPRMREEMDPKLGLLAALARFRAWYTFAAPQLQIIPAEAFPSKPHGAPVASPQTARALIEGFRDHAGAVLRAWKKLYEPKPRLRMGELLIEHFRFSVAGTHSTTVTLAGQCVNGVGPLYWPTIVTGDGQSWTPVPPSPPAGSPSEWIEVSHTFAPGAQLGSLTLDFGPLDVLERQTANLSAFVRRNANLIPGRSTDPAFVYLTPAVSFGNPIVPLIHRAALPPLTPSPTLAETLIEMLQPFSRPSGGLQTRLRLSASYAYALATPLSGPPLLTSTAIWLTDDAEVEDSPLALAIRAAQHLAAWFERAGPSTAGAQLRLALTLFATLGGQELPLVQLDSIPIRTAGLPPSWWGNS